MSSTTARNKKSAAVVKFTRKRTGCKTCRDRHMRCDEVFAPDCGNCRKVGRFCDRSANLAFRHFGLVENGAGGDGEKTDGRRGKRARRESEDEETRSGGGSVGVGEGGGGGGRGGLGVGVGIVTSAVGSAVGSVVGSEGEGEAERMGSQQLLVHHEHPQHHQHHQQYPHHPHHQQSSQPSPEQLQQSPHEQPHQRPQEHHSHHHHHHHREFDQRPFTDTAPDYPSMAVEESRTDNEEPYHEPTFSYDWQFPEMELELPDELFPSVSPSTITGPSYPPAPRLSSPQQHLVGMAATTTATAAAAAAAAAAARSPTRLRPESIEQHGVPTLTHAETMSLLRHFSTGPGAWNDVFDENQTFANIVPLRAVQCDTLLKACLAMSSHHLAIVGRFDRWKAVYLYNEAIQAVCHELLRINSSRTQTPNYVATPTTTAPPSASESLVHHHQSHHTHNHNHNNHTHRPTVGTPDTGQYDEDTGGIACALVIMAQIEMSIAADAPWRRHLQGCRDFFVLRHITASSPDKLARAAFITHARMDTVSAIIASCATLIPPIQWRIDPRIHCDPAGNSIAPTTDEGWASRVTKILADILEFRYDCARVHGEEMPRTAIRERWTALCGAVEAWREALPDSYRPVAVVPPTAPPAPDGEDSNNNTTTTTTTNVTNTTNTNTSPNPNANTTTTAVDDANDCPFPLTWYPRACVASAMYEYHAACILLLLSKPWHGGDMREAFKEMEGAVLARSRTAVGICIANRDPQTWVNSPQYLYIAGKALKSERERRRLEALLAEIEADTGWATAWRRTQLRDEWTR